MKESTLTPQAQISRDDLDDEFEYRVAERLGILCGANKPTPEQIAIARKEAEQTIAELQRPQLFSRRSRTRFGYSQAS